MFTRYIVKGGVWGEGWQTGDVIELDTDAAEVRLEKGDIEMIQLDKLPVAEDLIATEPLVAPEKAPEEVPTAEMESAASAEVATPEKEAEEPKKKSSRK
jgi:hypothetical protein